jgi:hypothetical protein
MTAAILRHGKNELHSKVCLSSLSATFKRYLWSRQLSRPFHLAVELIIDNTGLALSFEKKIAKGQKSGLILSFYTRESCYHFAEIGSNDFRDKRQYFQRRANRRSSRLADLSSESLQIYS